jgi:hypothetical protein
MRQQNDTEHLRGHERDDDCNELRRQMGGRGVCCFKRKSIEKSKKTQIFLLYIYIFERRTSALSAAIGAPKSLANDTRALFVWECNYNRTFSKHCSFVSFVVPFDDAEKRIREERQPDQVTQNAFTRESKSACIREREI